MALQGGFKITCGEVFAHGLGVVSTVSPLDDFQASSKERKVQAHDKDSGLPLWVVDVMDFDPDARERTFRVKIAAEVQPVPPEAIPGTPIRPVWLDGLTVTPWVDDRGNRPKIAYSLKATGMSAPRRLSDTSKAA